MSYTVYLLCFDKWMRPGPPSRGAGHYAGTTKTERLEQRLAEHRGSGGRQAKIIKALIEKYQSDFTLAKTWVFESKSAAYDFERRLKSNRSQSRLCPRHYEESNAKRRASAAARRRRINAPLIKAIVKCSDPVEAEQIIRRIRKPNLVQAEES